MEKRTAADFRAYISTYEAQYPVKKGYITHLILNEKLSIAEICNRIKDIAQTAEPDRQICEKPLRTSLYRFRKNAVKRVNYSQQWTDLLKMNQELFAIPFKSQESHLSAAQAPVPFLQLDLASAPVQPDLASAPIKPHFASAPIQTDLASAPVQPDYASAQNISETPVIVELTPHSVNNHNESCSVSSRSPSPKRLKRDCDNCVTKQRTNLNMVKENKSLRLQIRTLKQQHRQERKQMSFKILNEKIKRQSRAAALWRSKYTALRRQFKITQKINSSIHRKEGKSLKKVFDEEHKKLICSVEYLRNELAVTDAENARLRTELFKIKETETQTVGDIKS